MNTAPGQPPRSDTRRRAEDDDRESPESRAGQTHGPHLAQGWQDWIAPTPTGTSTPSVLADDPGDRGENSYTRWFDDALLDITPPTPSSPPVPESEQRGQSRTSKTVRGLGIGVVVAVIALVGAGVWQIRTSAQTQHVPAPTVAELVPATPSSPSPAPAPPWCPSEDGPQQLRGNSAGSTVAAPQVILALEHAYYVQRSAAAVRAVLDESGRFGSDAEIQAGIDAVPVGTEHCVRITPTGPDLWAVLITEKHPDGRTVVHAQTITTRQYPDRARVVAVETA